MLQRLNAHIRKFATTLLTERLDPASAAAAVFWGVFIGIVPIYGLQTLAAIGVALLLRLNKPLILAATFVNNPLLLPPTVAAAVELGGFCATWIVSSLASGGALRRPTEGAAVLVGAGQPAAGPARGRRGGHRHRGGGVLDGAFADAACASVFASSITPLPDARSSIAVLSAGRCGWTGFFPCLPPRTLAREHVVDLGCGYGMALCFAAFRDSGRRLVGCDLNAHRIAVAQQALRAFNAEVSVDDVRSYALPPAGLILILDVLQYLSAEDQLALLKRCCAALEPGGRLIFRVHDRERGLRSALTLGLDRLLFSAERVGARPTILEAAQYRECAAGRSV